jgi:hypothetical protein
MAKQVQAGSKSAYFRHIFEKNQDWLRTKSNEQVTEQWEKDHPGQRMSQQDRQSMANVKTILRKKLGIKIKKRRGKIKQTEDASVKPRASTRDLESLEFMIDDCLSLARRLDSETLHDVVRSLRRARNVVVWLNGQPS